jgi:hypothetical protein
MFKIKHIRVCDDPHNGELPHPFLQQCEFIGYYKTSTRAMWTRGEGVDEDMVKAI